MRAGTDKSNHTATGIPEGAMTFMNLLAVLTVADAWEKYNQIS